MLLIYSSVKNRSRLQYVANHIFNNVLGVEFKITSDKQFFLKHPGPAVNYSEDIINHGIQIIPNGLLWEKGVKSKSKLEISYWKGIFVFFSNEKGDILFDMFAASFYLLTLYEEHFPKKLDEHDRFDYTESLLYKNKVLEVPVIDRWAYLLRDEFVLAGFDINDFKLRKYQTVSTYDVDHPFIYRNKGFVKNAGGVVKDIFKRNFGNIKNRFLVQLHFEEDPYLKALMVINEVQKKMNKPYYLFVLLGDRGKYGITTLYSPKRYYDYIKKLDLVKIGLHPSYKSFRNLEQLIREKNQLEDILGYEVHTSRQHFLRMQNPETFQELILAGIKEDFTLAFAGAPGFRSGTAIPYYFYDIQKEEPTSLLIRPTIMMDTTLIMHMGLTPAEALGKIKELINECVLSGGDYLSLWHNSNLAYTSQKNPWISVYIQSYKYAVSLES